MIVSAVALAAIGLIGSLILLIVMLTKMNISLPVTHPANRESPGFSNAAPWLTENYDCGGNKKT